MVPASDSRFLRILEIINHPKRTVVPCLIGV
jgi:hypothetical protein